MPRVGVNNEPLLERAIFGFDGSDYRVVKVDTDGNLVAAVKASQSITVTQPNAANLKSTVTLAASQSIEVTQDTFADLKATVDNTPRIPEGATDLSNLYSKSVADGQWIELLSNTDANSLGGISGRTVASGKRLVVFWGSGNVQSTSGTINFGLAHGSTSVALIKAVSPQTLFAPTIGFYLVGDGSKVWKVYARNRSGSTASTVVTAIVWEEDVP